jgi:hypothetical protein
MPRGQSVSQKKEDFKKEKAVHDVKICSDVKEDEAWKMSTKVSEKW